MKKFLVTSLLILAIVTSLLAGTLSYYTTTVDNLAGGSVTAKEFIFLGEGEQSFTHSEAIAPSETVRWTFKVRNFNDTAVTETKQYYKLNIDVTNAEGKRAIEPLRVSIMDRSGIEHSVTGIGSFSILGDFPLQTSGQEHEYQVTLHWPNSDKDIDYAGNGFGNSVKVSAIASQAPFDTEINPVDPVDPGNPGGGEGEEPDEPTQKNAIEVNYRVVESWTSGNPENGTHQHKFAITITNNTDSLIEEWSLDFKFPSGVKLDQSWEATFTARGNDSYQLTEPSWKLPIASQSSIAKDPDHAIGGIATTPTTEIRPITDLKLVGKVNGEPITFDSNSIKITFTP